MTHAELATYMADRVDGWRSEEHRRQYVEGLVKALDARRCNCPGRCEAERPAANLTPVGAARLCPEILHDVAQYEITHQVLERRPSV